METGEKIISSVYIDEKSKSPEKLSTICYIESMLAQFMKTMSISNVKPCFIQTQFSLAESHFLYPSTKTAQRTSLSSSMKLLADQLAVPLSINRRLTVKVQACPAQCGCRPFCGQCLNPIFWSSFGVDGVD